MSVRNLSRAIIQGGRSGSSKWSRRYATRIERREVTRYVREVMREAEGEVPYAVLDFESGRIELASEHFGGNLVMPRRQEISPDFADRLGPLNRWLEAHVGRGWEEVYHKLSRFDRRCVAGRHLVDDHALKLVCHQDDHGWARTYIVDHDGILCRREDFESTRTRPSRPIRPYSFREEWAGGRKVMDRCGELFWSKHGFLTPFSVEDIEVWNTLRGYDQRTLKGYHRSGYAPKRRLNRVLPSQKRWQQTHPDKAI
jgi:hypothetical protein